MRTSSACNSMSSHTHPQKVQVALFTTVSVIGLLRLFMRVFDRRLVRTGRGEEHSPQGTTLARASHAARHVASWFDFFPSRNSPGLLGKREMKIGKGRPVDVTFRFIHERIP